MRLKYEELELLKKKYGVNRIWSFSRISTFLNCRWAYKLLYIDKIRANNDNVYTIMGTECHRIIQDYLANDIKYPDMEHQWGEFIQKWKDDPKSFQFDTKKIENGYLDNIEHYFKNTDSIPFKVNNEKPILIKLKDKDGKPFIFVGYADTEYKDDKGDLNIIDFKTSSKSTFSPKGLPKKSMQLILYAIGEHQRTGLPYDKIHCRFDMQKYCTVNYRMENGKWKNSIQARSEWVFKMSNKLKTKLPKAGVDPITTDEMIIEASQNNNMDNLPEEVRNQFRISNYYIDIELSEEICQKLEEKIIGYCKDTLELEDMGEDLNDYLEINFPYDSSNYYCQKLCAYHSSQAFKEEMGIIKKPLLDEQEIDNLFGNVESEDAEEDDELLKELLS
ncbi:PD-(D/E)XK nuclease family protein [Liquorilactobacillus hordei]|uniref:PD-(D/E)XK endonuclease-like domain-containing protein n=1 Tax=Liquorilactobacillus hordei DSM 19519 TaxID=1423759 RepID=A0A0R1MUE5_9LACO|nr:PD-(D/E)XK nuclease family protein [Liquorilactobacillus hordei]KRL07947.1 hypothetical protein FC92_GL001015 [Liquorilactobacillus hordei DSM 19519]QYH51106.1 PD-(D/E)XK nuclease family protein [Liquorilactobacillus hordei DSM 19519]